MKSRKNGNILTLKKPNKPKNKNIKKAIWNFTDKKYNFGLF